MLVTDVLAELGYTAIEAAEGGGGLEVLRSDARIDLLITDVGLPGGLNGGRWPMPPASPDRTLKVLFITGYAEGPRSSVKRPARTRHGGADEALRGRHPGEPNRGVDRAVVRVRGLAGQLSAT